MTNFLSYIRARHGTRHTRFNDTHGMRLSISIFTDVEEVPKFREVHKTHTHTYALISVRLSGLLTIRSPFYYYIIGQGFLG